MSIQKNYKGYRKIFDKYDININDSDKYLGKVKIYETIAKVVLLITFILCSILLYAAFTEKGNTGLGIAIIFIVVLFPGLILWKIFSLVKMSKIAKLDDLIFNKFLINKIKIFYSIDELQNCTYDKIEHINTRAYSEGNSNQAIINLTFMAFEIGAEGIIIVSNNSETVTAATINNKSSSTQINRMVNSSEAILIKNIKKEEVKSFDLNYWYELKEKGAISSQEYENKKRKLL
jgi:hypothetical protein